MPGRNKSKKEKKVAEKFVSEKNSKFLLYKGQKFF